MPTQFSRIKAKTQKPQQRLMSVHTVWSNLNLSSLTRLNLQHCLDLPIGVEKRCSKYVEFEAQG